MRARAFSILCGAVGLLWIAVGLALYAQFFRYHSPDGTGLAPMPMGPNGHYFVAFAGSAMTAWGGCLLVAARRPALGRGIAGATAIGLVMSALYRILAWVVGDYALLGNVLRFEAALLLLLALGMIWLRPAAPGAAEGT